MVINKHWATGEINSCIKGFLKLLFDAEPLILEHESKSDVVELSINKDGVAEAGDVRDIVIKIVKSLKG